MAKWNWRAAWDTLVNKKTPTINPPEPKSGGSLVNLPVGRQSLPPNHSDMNYISREMQKSTRVINPEFNRQLIPVIRKLCMSNPDLSQALQNVVNLGNTGHRINFDRNVEDSVVAKMRDHLTNKHRNWAPGQAGSAGLINRMFAQTMIAGALSTEWVISPDRKTIDTVLMVNPEEIVFILDKTHTYYQPYQIGDNNLSIVSPELTNLKKLNPLTYQYYALNGDGESPYGFPPYMAALRNICTQDKMNDNIDFVVDQLGLLGFLSLLVDVPDQMGGESDASYATRVNNHLDNASTQIAKGLKEGTLVGIKGSHEINFTSIGKDFNKVVELYKNNELQIGSAIKQDMTLMGRDYSTSESQITVVFMKMLSELRNIQNIIKTNLEFGYTLELRLAGYKFDYLSVTFDRSTIQDDLKFQQAQEYKIKNLTDLYLMGTISAIQFANEMGYEAPDVPKPRVSDDTLAGAKSQAPNAENSPGNPRKDQKTKSDRKGRDKNKPQGTKNPQ